MFRVTITYPHDENSRTFSNLTQKEANKIVTQVSTLQDTMGYVPVVVRVEAQPAA